MFKVGESKKLTNPKMVSLREFSNGSVDVIVDGYIVFSFIDNDTCILVDNGFRYAGIKFKQ